MGTSNSNSVNSKKSNNQERVLKKYLIRMMEAYNNLKILLDIYKNHNRICLDVFIISTKSIENFINCIKDSNVLNDLYQQNLEQKESLEKLKENFNNSNQDNDIKIYYKFEKCKEIAINNKEDENEFIIANKNFISNMNMDINANKEKTVIMNISRINKTKMKIEFQNNDKCLIFEEKSFGIFKFVKDNLDEFENLIYNENNNINLEINNNNNINNNKIINDSQNNYENIIQNPINKVINPINTNSITSQNQSDIEFLQSLQDSLLKKYNDQNNNNNIQYTKLILDNNNVFRNNGYNLMNSNINNNNNQIPNNTINKNYEKINDDFYNFKNKPKNQEKVCHHPNQILEQDKIQIFTNDMNNNMINNMNNNMMNNLNNSINNMTMNNKMNYDMNNNAMNKKSNYNINFSMNNNYNYYNSNNMNNNMMNHMNKNMK